MTATTRRVRSILLSTLAVTLAFALLVGLGTWQLRRMAWKEGLIAMIGERSTAPPVAAPPASEWPRLKKDDVEYRRVRLEGVFRHEDEVRVFTDLPQPKGRARGPGFWVLTPLVQADGSIVVVNRGFVPQDRALASTRFEGQVQGTTEVIGLVRWSEDRNPFTPADDPATGRWFTRDPQAIAQAKGLDRVAPFTVDAEESAPGGLPQGGETRLVLPNRHLEYALTWYALAAVLLVVAAAMLLRGRTREGKPR
jgi:surfeit locus 1 family protein